jgi:hypothetical protein
VAPVGQAADQPAGAAAAGARPAPDPLLDTGPAGLHSFNLGSVPASVTPPRSWRRAAWFMITASVAALIGLLLATTKLVGPSHLADHIDALPNFPSGVPLVSTSEPDQPGPQDGRHGGNRADPTNGANDINGANRARSASGRGGPANVADTSALAPAGSSVVGPTGDPSASITDTETPPVTTVGGPGPTTVDPTKLATRTQQFFAEVTSNVSAAAGLAATALSDDVRAVIQHRYGDISTIKVQSLTLDPRTGVTVSLLQVVGKDGSTTVRQTTLRFTLGGDPRIENPGG